MKNVWHMRLSIDMIARVLLIGGERVSYSEQSMLLLVCIDFANFLEDFEKGRNYLVDVTPGSENH